MSFILHVVIPAVIVMVVAVVIGYYFACLSPREKLKFMNKQEKLDEFSAETAEIIRLFEKQIKNKNIIDERQLNEITIPSDNLVMFNNINNFITFSNDLLFLLTREHGMLHSFYIREISLFISSSLNAQRDIQTSIPEKHKEAVYVSILNDFMILTSSLFASMGKAELIGYIFKDEKNLLEMKYKCLS